MGRGRAKAKQTKVARELKYRSYDTDFNQLARELHGEDRPSRGRDDESDDYGDPYSERYDDGAPAPRR